MAQLYEEEFLNSALSLTQKSKHLSENYFYEKNSNFKLVEFSKMNEDEEPLDGPSRVQNPSDAMKTQE